LSKDIEIEAKAKMKRRPVLSESSKPLVLKLSTLFAVDSFGGGFILQNIIALYFYERFALQLDSLGPIFSATQIVTAISFLVAERIARRIGLLNTMVFSHIPSNLFLASIAFATCPVTAVVLLLCRHSLSQMDVPTRQSYVMAVIEESDRVPAAGFTNVARTFAQAFGPFPSLYALANIWIGTPFVAAGTLKLVYDLTLYSSFRRTKPPEETAANP
jgi:MFS family permease